MASDQARTPEWLATRRAAMARPAVARLLKWGSRANVAVYRRTNGRVGGSWRVGSALRAPVPVLLLDHVGRRSGRRFTTPLLHLADGDDIVVVASSGGMPHDPQWYRNLMASPVTTVQVRDRVVEVVARTATPAERARLWPLLVDTYADFATYAQLTDREIPVVILSPR